MIKPFSISSSYSSFIYPLRPFLLLYHQHTKNPKLMNDQRAISSSRSSREGHQDEHIRDIYALTPTRARRRETWETSNNFSSSLSMEVASSDRDLSSLTGEFGTLVLADSTLGSTENDGDNHNNNHLGRIREEEGLNPLAIVSNGNAFDPEPLPSQGGGGGGGGGGDGEVVVHRVRKEEVQAKINAWQTAKVARINNRFKREEAVIGGRESEMVRKATSKMKKIERKLEEKRAMALEKMENEVAKAHRTAEEKKASAEAKRGTKVAKVLQVANLMRAVGRPPAKHSF